jgi:hypothetical protein
LDNNNCKGCDKDLDKQYVITHQQKQHCITNLIEWCNECYNNKVFLENCHKEAHSPQTRKKAANTRKKWLESDKGLEWKKMISKHNSISTKKWRDSLTEEEKRIINKKSSDSQINNILNGSFDPQKNYKHYRKNIGIINGEELVFRSSWEVIFAISNPHLEYESLRIPYFKNNGRKGIYIPDFIDNQNKIIYELKPRRNYIKQQTKMDASINWCLKNGYKFIWINEDNLLYYISENDNLFEENKKFYEKAYKGLNGYIKNKINKKDR